VKGLIKFLIFLVLIFIVSSLFKGGDYVRSISNLTGIDLYSLADTADTMRVERFMSEKKQTQGEKEKAILGN
jgi:hypothetical protein